MKLQSLKVWVNTFMFCLLKGSDTRKIVLRKRKKSGINILLSDDEIPCVLAMTITFDTVKIRVMKEK